MRVALASCQRYYCPTITKHAGRHCHVGRRLVQTRQRDRRCAFPPGLRNFRVALARCQRQKDARCTGTPPKIKSCAWPWSRPVPYYLDLTFPHLHWPPLPKIKRCALHWHAAKDKKLRIALVSPSFVLPGFNISAFALDVAKD